MTIYEQKIKVDHLRKQFVNSLFNGTPDEAHAKLLTWIIESDILDQMRQKAVQI